MCIRDSLGKVLRRLAAELVEVKAAEPFSAVVVDLGDCLAVLRDLCFSRQATGDNGTAKTRKMHELTQRIASAVDVSAMAVQGAGRKAAKVHRHVLRHTCGRQG